MAKKSRTREGNSAEGTSKAGGKHEKCTFSAPGSPLLELHDRVGVVLYVHGRQPGVQIATQ